MRNKESLLHHMPTSFLRKLISVLSLRSLVYFFT